MTKTDLKDDAVKTSGSEEIEHSLERRDIAFESLFRLFEKIGTTFELETIIKLLLMTVVGQLGLRRVAFFLRKERTSRLDLYHSIGLARDVEFPSFSLDSSFMKWMIEIEGVIMIDDFFKSQGTGQEEDKAIGEALVNGGFSYICDLKEGDNLFGIMAFSQKVSGQDFSAFDRELLVMMSRVAAITIRNASLYHSVLRSKNELENFVRIKKEFIDHTSHELRTPITVLRSSLWSIDVEGGDEMALMEMARDSVLRLEEKVENILSLNKMEINGAFIEPLIAEISDLVISTCREMSEILEEKEIILDIRNGIGEKYISVDPVRLKIVLRNILENAMNSIGCKGSVHIKLSLHTGGPGSNDGIEISAWESEREEDDAGALEVKTDSWVVIRIIDNGRGIPADEVLTIGRPFIRASNSAVGDIKGFGVGLSVAQKIVAAHNGKIYCRSVEKEGAEFSIWLPDR